MFISKSTISAIAHKISEFESRLNRVELIENKNKTEIEKEKVFLDLPNELKTLEVDTDKKMFNINGIPFGKGIESFDIHYEARERKISVEFDSHIKFASYDMYGSKIGGGIRKKVDRH